MSKKGSAIDRAFERGLAALVNSGEPEVLQGGRKGVEKESLRVTPVGNIATTPHPRALGSALTSGNITTDYSEALLEFVTPTFRSSWELLQYLCDLHQFAYRHLDDELLWATSMPCALQGDDSIPIAEYGSSNIGKMKTIYRRGLGIRYGRIMQAISGVHFNYSFPERFWEAWRTIRGSRASDQDFVSSNYFHLLRNYRRHGWIVLYLFGVSPAVCESFLRGRDFKLPELQPGTAFEPYATSLRMSDLGYRNRNQAGLKVSVNSLDEYLRDLSRAISTPHPDYEQLGVKVNGEYQQLNANVLQIENEYYSFIRPKRVARSGERPTKALQRAGVEYVEVRALDVSAYDPVGVNQNKLRFLEVFLAYCVLRDSPFIEDAEQAALDANHLAVAHRGREPGLMLTRDGRQLSLQHWAHEILDSMQGVAEILDRGDDAQPYSTAVALQKAKLDDVALTPSARLLAEMSSTGESFFEVSLRMSRLHKEYFLALYPPNTARLAEFAAGASDSLAAQQALEATDQGSFEQYLAAYFAS
ncbi:MAG TPA: glutamate--cysteine ligase [Steroidobacteraceae bacterium]|nr:glutamate--cysteine ligase [Steroidobacteraceae bacterium]HRX90678.1 glutamate--cysteine ligase [Steroidobacteraceae bacterium]